MIVCSKDKIKNLSFVFFIGFLLLASCRKNEGTVGSDFVGNIAGLDLQFSDTSTIISYTSKHDSIPTRSLSYYMLGELNDAAIGTSKATIVSQLALPIENFSWGSNIIIDSIVLQANFATKDAYYGDKATVQTIKVFELNETLRADSQYYSNRIYNYDQSKPIGTWQGNFNAIGDSVRLAYANTSYVLSPHIRIKLDDAAFINKFRLAENGAFVSTTAFQSYIKGLVIVPSSTLSPGQGAVAYMNMLNTVSSVVVYYNGGKLKTEFPFYKSSAVKANAFTHTYLPGVDIQPLMKGSNRTRTFAQPMTGLKTRIYFPHLFEYVKNKNIAITGAEIIFTPEAGSFSDPYKLPDIVRLLTSDSLGRNEIMRDFVEGSDANQDGVSDYFGGVHTSSNEYRFNVIRELQYTFNEYKKNNRNVHYGFNLIVQADNPVSGRRVILDTRPGKIKLKLSYTVIK